MRKYYIYSFGHIDHRWTWAPTVKDFIQNKLFYLHKLHEKHEFTSDDHVNLKLWMEDGIGLVNDLDICLKAAKEHLTWEGSFQQEPRIFLLPDDIELSYGFMWKQHNNGTTFVASPRPLDWLHELLGELIAVSQDGTVEKIT